MASAKEAKVVRDLFNGVVQTADVPGYAFVGMTDEGNLFQCAETGDFVVVKSIVKAEGFDGFDAVDAHNEKLAKAAEKAAAKAAKEAKEKGE